jgi:hypothetical protein
LKEEKAVVSHRTPAENGQANKFVETARKLEADEDEAAFKAKLAQIARAKPQDTEPAKRKIDKSK